MKFDAIGLGVFTIIGATFAYNLFELNFLAILLAGVLTAIGGGILRDLIVSQVPIVFVKEFYVSASFIGITDVLLDLIFWRRVILQLFRNSDYNFTETNCYKV